MNSRTHRARRTLGIECLEGRLALSGGLATVAPAAHARGHHAEVEHHKGHKVEAAAHHANSASKGHDDPASHHDDPAAHHDDPATHHDDPGQAGETGHHGGKDDTTGHA